MLEFQTNSSEVKKGDIFVAIKGQQTDGHNFISDAIKNGASKIVVEKDVSYPDVEIIKVDDTKKYLFSEIEKKYESDLKDLVILGVTGTNGKTTSCYLTYQMLNDIGIKTAYIGTIGFYYNDVKRELNNTTPDIITLYNLLYEAKENGCTHIVMEVSSHSLEGDRVHALKFTSVAFTNLTQDHLDFHKTMENYLNAKLKILNYLKEDSTVIVNNDDKYAPYFLNNNYKKTTIGYKEDSSLKIINTKLSPNNTIINFSDNGKEYEVTTNLISQFNVYNYLTCFALLKSINISDDIIIDKTKDLYAPKGRCEIIDVNKGYAVIDYAHTPDAVEKIVKTFNELKKNRIITIIGCGGDRDPLKRPIMGKIACEYSDFVIFTNDNPRTEDPVKIMNDIIKDLKYNNFKVIYDRKEAIIDAINNMEDNDIILLLGKGHEDYQIIGTEKIHFDDCEVVMNWNK